MKIKNTNVRIGFLLFLLSFTVTSMLNQNFTPQSILETPKTSDGEITIITPENKNYTEPMHGYYPATYGFENELTGTSRTSIDYVDGTNAIQSNCDVEIFNYYGGHYKVLRIHDGNTAGNAEAQHFFDSSQTTGTIEWWWFSPTVSNNQMSIHFHQDQIGTHAFSLSAVDDEFLQNNGTAVQTYNSYQWYHHKVSFDTISDTYDWYIDGLMVVNGGAFENPVLNVGSTNLKGAWSTTGESYFDAFGYSWSPDYDIGNNFYEGLLLSYEKTTTLDWQGYSLDGNANKTINGDTTIPIPSNGPHRIQVFGNDFMGRMYESEIRYFVVWVNTIAITIISPTSHEFFQDSAPNFEIYIDDPHVTATWYSLDKGVTCFPFTGFTGTIDQTEWDKFSDGVITIVFYVNNSNEGEGNARVQVFKENFLLPDNPYLVPILLTSITFVIFAMLGITLFLLRKKISPRTRSFVDYQPKNLVNENIDSRKDQPYFCPFCGSRIKIPSRFCAICGASLENL